MFAATAASLPAHSHVAALPPPPTPTTSVADSAGCALALLFRQVQHDTEGAFQKLHDQTRDRVHAAVLAVLRSPDLSCEVVQEVYLEVWQQRRTFDPSKGSVSGWMTTIARRRAVDRVRAVVRSNHRDTRHADSQPAPVEPDHQDQVAAALDAIAPVRRALAQLTPLQQEAVLLTYWQGHSTTEAASLLGIPVPTLKSRLHAARSRLRDLLDHHQPILAAQMTPTRTAALA